MTLGPTAFAVIIWVAVLAVLVIFGYQVYTLAVDAGWLDSGADVGADGDRTVDDVGEGG